MIHTGDILLTPTVIGSDGKLCTWETSNAHTAEVNAPYTMHEQNT
jgi:hypothetical protein